MNNKLKKILMLFIVSVILFTSIPKINISIAADSDMLIKMGTGKYQITVTKGTKVDDIIKVLGEPKIKTPSAFGGEAYTFYTDDKYNNYLYIETTAEGKIISFGSVDPTYSTQTYSYGDNFPFTANTPLYGCLVPNGNKVAGGVYYNMEAFRGKSSTISEATLIKDDYKARFETDVVKYTKAVSEHAVTMFNALSTRLGNECHLKFDEDVFYINEQLKENGTSIRDYLSKAGLSTKYLRGLGTKEKVELSKSNYIFNPMQFANIARDNLYFTHDERNVAVFDYNYQEKILRALAINKDVLKERSAALDLTVEEQNKLKAGREKYKEAERLLNADSEFYDIQPVTTPASGLVAGKIKKNKLLGITEYVNMIRVAGGEPELQHSDEASDVAQHVSTLMSYRLQALGEQIQHNPPKPDGVTDEFYYAAMGYGKGYRENLGNQGNVNVSPSDMKLAINLYLDESYDITFSGAKLYGHRQNLLDSSATQFGFGMSPYMNSVQEYGTSGQRTEIEAWPTKGVTFLESVYSSRFTWTTQFIKNYEVQDNTTVSVKCLNTGEKWDFTSDENTNNRYFAKNKQNALTSLKNRLIYYDSSIFPISGYVYEITVNNLKDINTGNTSATYTYRSVFENADESKEVTLPTSVTISVPQELKKDSQTQAYIIPADKTTKLSATVSLENCIDKNLKWESSNPDIISVTQNGTLTVNKQVKTPVTITVYALNNKNAKATVKVIPQIKTVEKVVINEENLQMRIGNQKELKASYIPEDATVTSEVAWESNNNEVVSIDSKGKIKALKEGEAIITATLDGVKGTCNVKVLPCFTMDTKQYNQVGEKEQLKASTSRGVDVVVNWKSSKPDVISTEDGGYVTPKSGGFAKLTATDSLYGEVEVWVYVSVPIQLSDGSTRYAGDLDGNGVIDVLDASCILDIYRRGGPTPDELKIADINGDGVVDIIDSSCVQDIYRYDTFKIVKQEEKPPTEPDPKDPDNPENPKDPEQPKEPDNPETGEGTTTVTKTAEIQNYTKETKEVIPETVRKDNFNVYWTQPSQTYDFVDEDNNYNLVIAGKENVYWTKYNDKMEPIKEMVLPMLCNKDTLYADGQEPMDDSTFNFGNAIYKDKYLYVIYGQYVPPSDKNKKALVAAKYNSDGNLVKSSEISGLDLNPSSYYDSDGTNIPFYSGECDLTINDDGVLCGIMARHIFGGHETSMMFFVDTETLHWVSNFRAPQGEFNPTYTEATQLFEFTSHSFGQRILSASNGDILTMEVGDANARGMVLTKFTKYPYTDSEGARHRYKVNQFVPFHFREGGNSTFGYNQVYSVTGNILEVSDGYLYLGASEKTLSRDYGFSINESWNIFAQKYKKNFETCTTETMQMFPTTSARTPTGSMPTANRHGRIFLTGNEKDYGIKWMTNYNNDTGGVIPEVKAIPIEDNKIVVLWEVNPISKFVYNGVDYGYSRDTSTRQVYYEIIDENANVVDGPYKVDGVELNRQSNYTYKDGNIIWCTSEGDAYTKEITIHKLEVGKEKSYTLGDVNEDGDITAEDAKNVLDYIAGKVDFTTEQTEAANVNGDDDITAEDAKRILDYIAGKIISF